MPSHHEVRRVKHSPQQMFDLVADIEQYPVFIPWCTALRIRENNVVDGRGEMTADMAVRYKMFTETFLSKVILDPDEMKIKTEYVDGPFRTLHNVWHFQEGEPRGCNVDFRIKFEFKNLMLQAAAMQVFDKAFLYMSNAFIARANELYG
ncbi:MAG: type II toxin-antitoxin system RatA family toxin [bacterium]